MHIGIPMTDEEKIHMVKVLLEVEDTDASEDKRIETYLHIAETEILNWRYSYASMVPLEVPKEYEMTQIHAVLAGYSVAGAENQTSDSEGVIHRVFKYEDMIAYIRAHVIPIARCI